jgi:hypothetical protein
LVGYNYRMNFLNIASLFDALVPGNIRLPRDDLTHRNYVSMQESRSIEYMKKYKENGIDAIASYLPYAREVAGGFLDKNSSYNVGSWRDND